MSKNLEPVKYKLDQHPRYVDNEMQKMRRELIDSQKELVTQVEGLKVMNQEANLQRYDALREIAKLKEDLEEQRKEEANRRKYMYDLLVDRNKKMDAIERSIKIPSINDLGENFMEIPRNQQTGSGFVIHEHGGVIPHLQAKKAEFTDFGSLRSNSTYLKLNERGYNEVF